jgi:hypothetical protein
MMDEPANQPDPRPYQEILENDPTDRAAYEALEARWSASRPRQASGAS